MGEVLGDCQCPACVWLREPARRNRGYAAAAAARERAIKQARDIALIRDALRELAGDPTDADIAAWLQIPGESVDGEKLPF